MKKSFDSCLQYSTAIIHEIASAFKRKPYEMVKYCQTICRITAESFLSVFNHFVGLVFKELMP